VIRDEGEMIGRFKVRNLMRDLGLVSKQPGSHAYKQRVIKILGSAALIEAITA
jgi:putative transposase